MSTLDNFRLDNRVVIVTGGVGLLGQQYAAALADAGAHVIIADLNAADCEALAQKISAETGNDALGIGVDITYKSAVNTMIQTTLDRFGRIDGLVNNAAINPAFDEDTKDQHVVTFENYPVELWNQSLQVNLTGMFLCSQAVAPTMLDQGRGVIVNISSTYGLVGPDQKLYEPEDAATPRTYKPVDYSVTKSAVLGFTKYLAAYWEGKGIRVNTLTLGGVLNRQSDAFIAAYSKRNPLHRMAEQTDYNGALIYLLSDASSYMTGSNMVVDGGWTAW